MKSIQEPKTLVRSGVQKSTECGLVVNAKAFEMLARQYSDPIKAILQEISANAADSHIRAGIEDRPFDVKLPNSLDPHFRVRDYGVSMSRETIYNVYINYMKSDKTDTNSETGFFGIGSKTPLAYTDSFNIKTYIDGKMNLYTLGYNENGIPELNEFAEYDTDEEDGVEISFSVKLDDFSKFSEKASHVFSFFDTKPSIAGVSSFETKTLTKVLEGDDWYFFKESMNADSYVVCGNIAYPISTYDLELGYSNDIGGLLHAGVVVKVPIGSVNMTPSRESLEFSEKTVKFLKSKLTQIKEELNQKINEEIDECESAWDARIRARELYNSFGYHITQSLELNTWRGQELPRDGSLDVDKKYYQDGGRIKRSNEPSNLVPMDKHTVVVIKDIDRKFDSRCRHLCNTIDKNIYLVHNNPDEIKATLHFLDEEGIVYKASELEDPPRNAKRSYVAGVTRKTATTVLRFDPNGNHHTYGRKYEARYWEQDIEVDLNEETTEEKVWVEWFNYDISSKGNSYHLRHLIGAINKAGIDIPDIYGVKKGQKRKVSKASNWIPLDEWLSKKVEEVCDDEFRIAVSKADKASDINFAKELSKVFSVKTIPLLDSDSVFSQLSKIVQIVDAETNVGAYKELARMCRYDLNLDEVKDEQNVEEICKSFEERYPLVVDYFKNTYVGYIDDKEADMIISTVNATDYYLS